MSDVVASIRKKFGNDADFDEVTEALESYQLSVDNGTTVQVSTPPRSEPKIEDYISSRTPITPSAHSLSAQKDAIADIKSGRIDLNANGNTVRKGNFGEMLTDEDLVNRGFTPLHDRVTDIDQPLSQGLDGIFEKDGKYFIVESKYGCSALNNKCEIGRQMSQAWILDRLNSTNLAISLRNQIRANYTPVLAKISEEGTVAYKKLNANGYVVRSAKKFTDIFGGG